MRHSLGRELIMGLLAATLPGAALAAEAKSAKYPMGDSGLLRRALQPVGRCRSAARAK